MSVDFYNNRKRYDKIKADNIKNSKANKGNQLMNNGSIKLKKILNKLLLSTGNNIIDFSKKKIYYEDEEVDSVKLIYDENLIKIEKVIKLWDIIVSNYNNYCYSVRNLQHNTEMGFKSYYTKERLQQQINNNYNKLLKSIQEINQYE